MMNDSKSMLATRASKKSNRAKSRNKKVYSEYGEQSLAVIPPDGGWGWVVVAASFLSNFLVDGMMYTFGIFLDEISESFNVRVTQLAVANSIMCGFYYVVGPITCALANRFGFRVVGIIGGIIVSAALFLSTIFNNFVAFNIFIGCFCGIGFNMIFLPSLLIVGFYFEKWRALATAISVCGSSIGVIAFPPVVTTLLRKLSWRWKFRLLSGLFGIIILCCMLFKPIKPVLIDVTDDRGGTSNSDSDDNDSIGSFYIGSIKQIFQNRPYNLYPTQSDLLATTRRGSDFPSTSRNYSNPSVFTNKTDAVSVGLHTVYEIDDDDDDDDSYSRDNVIECCAECCCCCCCRNITQNTATSIRTSLNRPVYRDDLFYMGSFSQLSEMSRSKTTIWSVPPSTRKSYIVTRAETRGNLLQDRRRCLCLPETFVRTVAAILDVKLLKSPSFLLLLFSGFFTLLGIYCPFIFIVNRAQEMKIDKDWSTLLLTVIGISNTVGRIACGIVSCIPKCDTLIISYVTLFITGGIIIISNYLPTLKGQMMFAILFGFNIASLTVLRSVVIVELVGLKNLTNAFGIITMFYGLASFLGVPIAGLLRRLTGHYEASFIFSGCSLLLSALLLIPIRRTAKWEANKKKPKVT